MATKQKLPHPHSLIQNPLVRILGQHAPAHVVLQQTTARETLPIQVRAMSTPPMTDYALIDLALTLDPQPPPPQQRSSLPPSGGAYATFTPSQRYRLLQWLNVPTEPAPSAFQQFYLAQLEVALLEPQTTLAVITEVQRLQQAPAWYQQLGLARLCLLAYWLTQDGNGLGKWLQEECAPGPLLGVALGMQALLQQALQPPQIAPLFHHWAVEAPLPSSALLALRLTSLAATLGAEVLAYALGQLEDGAREPRPWRTHHRDLRIALPQPDLRPVLEPLLRDLALMSDESTDIDTNPTEEADLAMSATGGQLVLEFGESRSDFFTFALEVAQQQAGYVALMDEDRRMVHRVYFQKGEMRRFWRLWEYVQSWSSTKVYLNGDEINKTELYARLWHVR